MFKKSGEVPDWHVDRWGQLFKGWPSNAELGCMLRCLMLICWVVYMFNELEGDCVSGSKILKENIDIPKVFMIIDTMKIDDWLFPTIWACSNFRKCEEVPCWHVASFTKGNTVILSLNISSLICEDWWLNFKFHGATWNMTIGALILINAISCEVNAAVRILIFHYWTIRL